MEIAIKFNGNLGYICGIVTDDGTVGNQMPKYYCCDVFKKDFKTSGIHLLAPCGVEGYHDPLRMSWDLDQYPK